MIKGHTGFLFLDKNGNPEVAMHWQHRLNHMVKRYKDIYRVQMPNITPHVCRHTYCSNMAKSGMNPKTLQYLMGHSDISVTMNTYMHGGRCCRWTEKNGRCGEGTERNGKRTEEADEPENVQGNLIWKRKTHAEGVATGQLPFWLWKNHIQKRSLLCYNSDSLFEQGEKTPVVIWRELYYVLTTIDDCVLHRFAKFCVMYHRFCENKILYKSRHPPRKTRYFFAVWKEKLWAFECFLFATAAILP